MPIEESEELPGFTRKIKRQICQSAIPAVAALGKAQCVLGVMFCDVSFKGWSGFVLSAFCLDWDDFGATLQDEIDLTVLIGVVARFYFKLTVKLLKNIVLRQRALKLIVSLQKNGTVVDSGHTLKKPCIKEKKLELIQLVKGGQRMLHF